MLKLSIITDFWANDAILANNFSIHQSALMNADIINKKASR